MGRTAASRHKQGDHRGRPSSVHLPSLLMSSGCDWGHICEQDVRGTTAQPPETSVWHWMKGSDTIQDTAYGGIAPQNMYNM